MLSLSTSKALLPGQCEMRAMPWMRSSARPTGPKPNARRSYGRFPHVITVQAKSSQRPPLATDQADGPKKTLKLEINAHLPINVLDAPDSDALFPLLLSVQLLSEKGQRSEVTHTDDWRATTFDRQASGVEMKGATWKGSISVPADFGTPGALLVIKEQKTPKGRLTVYLSTVSVPEVPGLTFHCHSTVAPSQGERVFFPSKAKLPSETPDPIKALRDTELSKLRGEGRPDPNAMLVDTERVYEYDTYRDLGMPWKGEAYVRPTLGGKDMPFPRRLTSNRGNWVDPQGNPTEYELPVDDPNPIIKLIPGIPPNCPYLPLDEQWNNTKDRGFLGSAGAAVLGLVQAQIKTLFRDKLNNTSFISLHAVDAMYQHSPLPPQSKQDGNPFKFDDAFVENLRAHFRQIVSKFSPGAGELVSILQNLNDETLDNFLKSRVFSWPTPELMEKLLTFPVPRVRKDRSLDDFTDAEFGRQLLAGQHPCTIKAATADWLKDTPFTEADVEGMLEGKSLSERIAEGGRMFCIDYVAGFLDYMERIDNQRDLFADVGNRPALLDKQRKQHAGRVLLYYTDEGYLLPVAIQLIDDPSDTKGTIYTPKDPTELWTLAKAIFNNLDFAYHQVVSHYLIGHAVQEPYIIAMMRNVSALHPVFKLMRPHFRYTLHVNGFGRVVLIAAGMPVEDIVGPGMYGMQLCSFVYDKVYNFKLANFENDLISRGMVATEGGKPVRDADGRLKPAIDYPFAEDGLDIWYAMHQWFGSYLRLYYDDNTPDKKVTEDPEIMAFWKELIEKGHPDKVEGWVELTDIASLTDILTTIAFNGSVHHTAVNFGNYDYSAFSPNRPSIIRRPIPKKNSKEVEALQANFEQEFLTYTTAPADAMTIATVFRILSTHADNEQYLDDDKSEWIQDDEALTEFNKFVAAMKKLDADIEKRNADNKSKIRSAQGSRGYPYNLLRPHSEAGPTGQGVPYSTTI